MTLTPPPIRVDCHWCGLLISRSAPSEPPANATVLCEDCIARMGRRLVPMFAIPNPGTYFELDKP